MRILKFAFDNWFSRAYWLLVVATFVLVATSYATWDQPDANMAGVWLIFVTAPFSVVGILGESMVGIWLGMFAGAFLNATIIGAIVHAVGRALGRHRRIA